MSNLPWLILMIMIILSLLWFSVQIWIMQDFISQSGPQSTSTKSLTAINVMMLWEWVVTVWLISTWCFHCQQRFWHIQQFLLDANIGSLWNLLYCNLILIEFINSYKAHSCKKNRLYNTCWILPNNQQTFDELESIKSLFTVLLLLKGLWCIKCALIIKRCCLGVDIDKANEIIKADDNQF